MIQAEFLSYNAEHHRNMHEIYSLVPQVLSRVLRTLDPVEGFVIGGSYAKGTYRTGDDIDFDTLLGSNWNINELEDIRYIIEQEFNKNNMLPDLRAMLKRSSIDRSLRQSLYSRHPNSPYVVRSPEVANAWGLYKI